MSSDDHLTPQPDWKSFSLPPAQPRDGFQDDPSDPPVLEVVEEEIPLRRQPAPRPPHPGFWWAILWSIGFFIFMIGAMFVAVIVAVIFRAATSGNVEQYLRSLQRPAPGQAFPPEFAILMMPGFLVAELATIFYAWLAIRLVVGREWPRRLAFRIPSTTHLLLALLSLPGLIILATGVATLAREYMHWLGIPDLDDQSTLGELAKQWPLWFGILTVGLGPGIGEELLCRGFFGRGLVGRHGPVIGVVLTSLIFGALHMDPALILGTAVIGVWLHYVYLQSRSLLLPMLLHFLNNSLAVILSTLALEDPAPDPHGAGLLAYGGALGLLLAVGCALWWTRARLVPTDDGPGWQPPYPGVEEPPPGSGTVVERPWPSWAAVLVAILGIALFLAGLRLSGQMG